MQFCELFIYILYLIFFPLIGLLVFYFGYIFNLAIVEK